MIHTESESMFWSGMDEASGYCDVAPLNLGGSHK